MFGSGWKKRVVRNERNYGRGDGGEDREFEIVNVSVSCSPSSVAQSHEPQAYRYYSLHVLLYILPLNMMRDGKSDWWMLECSNGIQLQFDISPLLGTWQLRIGEPLYVTKRHLGRKVEPVNELEDGNRREGEGRPHVVLGRGAIVIFYLVQCSAYHINIIVLLIYMNRI